MTDLIIGNVTVSNRNELFRINDLHKAAGGANKHRPKYWLESQQTKEFIAYQEGKVGNPTLKNKTSDTGGIPPVNNNSVLLVINEGKHKGTYVSKKLVYLYAMWISPEFLDAVIDAYDKLVVYGNKYDAALERFKKEMLLEVPSDWRKLFTDDFYIPVCRLWNIRFQGNGGGLPYSIAQFTLNWVYRPILPVEVFNEIKQNRNGEKMHQWFSDGGKQRLIHHLMMVSGIAKTCRDYSDFKNKAGCVFSDAPLQLEMF